MFFVAMLLALIGFLSTGSNRTRIYTGWKARLGGCISCAIFLVFTYAAHLFWIFVFSVVVALTVIYFIFYRVCLLMPDYTTATCLDLSVFSPVLNMTGRPASLKICGSNLQQFCTLAETASNYYAIAYFAAAAVMLSLVHFMICLAANYAHIKHGYKYFELKEVEENELGRYRDTYASY
ncbi:unnamed protein product [Soboliphyme baturini]|uniref:MARVEL domain-containing protein n=1 Tax=Soboliphyme baturini TaxID=241478 RepID=A0A183J2A2_9BILA|nr:unnamed protein product [Soboliphyme baturini]